MLANFETALHEPWRYRQLFWECGVLGQVLYLEAEAAGVRSTGIGCFFDDEMHGLLGIGDHRWQSLYHFTMGGAVDDPRLSTMPPYQFEPCTARYPPIADRDPLSYRCTPSTSFLLTRKGSVPSTTADMYAGSA